MKTRMKTKGLAAKAERRGQRLRKILVPVDFSAASQQALRYATRLARRHGAAISLLHVVTPIMCHANYGYGPVVRHVPNEPALKRARRRLNRLRISAARGGKPGEYMVRSGVVFFEITEVVRQMAADLVIMGAHGQAAAENSETGGTADKVIRQAPCPVLVVHGKEDEINL